MSPEDRVKEGDLGFGQVAATLILLLRPLINSANLWWGVSYSSKI